MLQIVFSKEEIIPIGVERIEIGYGNESDHFIDIIDVLIRIGDATVVFKYQNILKKIL